MCQMNTKCTKWSSDIPNFLKIVHIAIKYLNIFPAKALRNLPKLGFFGLKMNHLATLLLRSVYMSSCKDPLGYGWAEAKVLLGRTNQTKVLQSKRIFLFIQDVLGSFCREFSNLMKSNDTFDSSQLLRLRFLSKSKMPIQTKCRKNTDIVDLIWLGWLG
jgi:hypothetical protein